MAFIGNNVQTQGFTPAVDYFSGTGVAVTFTLSRPVAASVQVEAVIDNVVQNPSTAYTVSGNAITFSSAPLSGTNNIYVRYTSLVTTYAAISQSPSVIGDITASGGYLSTGVFSNTYVDGTVVDYVTGNGRLTVGAVDGFTLYTGGTSARTALASWDSSGNLTNTGSIGSPAATALTLKSAGTTAVTIDASQNVGIGTSSPVSSGGYTALTLNNATNSGYVVLQTNGTTTADWYVSGGTIATFRGVNVPLALTATGANFISASTNGTERMRIDSSGKVGIGTTSPGRTLEVYSSAPAIKLNNGTYNWTVGTGAFIDGTDSLVFYSGTLGGEVGRFDGAGNLFVGTTNTASGGFEVSPNYNSTLSSAFIVGHASGSASGAVYGLFRYGANSIGSITQTGTTAVLYNTTSDYRLKNDVKPIQNALATVEALNPVSFTWIDGRPDDGFLAHEIQAVIPNCVTGEKDAVNEDGTPKYQQMDNSGVIPFLVKAIQELNAKVTALEAKLEAK